MIRVSNVDKKHAPDIYITDPVAIDGARLIPISLGGRLAAPVNELGKQLLKSAADGDTSEIRRLLTEGAPFTADWLGTSPLHLAAQGNHIDVCELLVRAGISTNARTKVDRTPLHMAACEGHMDIVELFVQEGAEIDCTDLLDMTPLHWAVQNGHADVVRFLLKCGARKFTENKFGLKPIDIAHQIDRHDLIELLEEVQHEDPTIAAENLAIVMAEEDQNQHQQRTEVTRLEEESAEDADEPEHHLDDDDELIDNDSRDNETNTNNTLADSMKILQEHGITMLPNDDDNNILSTVMESGHSVVLTDVGKQVLDSVKAAEEASDNINRNLAKKNYITVTADEFLALAANATINKNQAQIIRQVNGKMVPKTIKRIVMKKNKVQMISPVPNILKQKLSSQQAQNAQTTNNQHQSSQLNFSANETNIEIVTKQLAEARKTIEEYKQKLMQKEAEAEGYKQQLNLLMEYS